MTKTRWPLKKILTEEDEAGAVGFDDFNQLCYAYKTRNQDLITRAYGIINVRGKTCSICKKTWEMTTKSFLDQFFLLDQDKLVHMTCFVGHLAIVEKDVLFEGIRHSKVTCSNITEIPNRYGGAWNTPWYLVEVKEPKATIIFGKRKRVYSIEVSLPKEEDAKIALDLLEGEDVTKEVEGSSILVHAWKREDVGRYLGIIFPERKEAIGS